MSSGAGAAAMAARMRGERENARLKILAVEDSPSARKVFQAVLLRLGVSLQDLRLASSSTEAFQLFSDWRPDLVFVDVELRRSPARPSSAPVSPERAESVPMDGDELAKHLLAKEPELKLVVVTAYDRDNPRVKALLKIGAADVIVKPVLASRVQEILNRFSPSKDSRERPR